MRITETQVRRILPNAPTERVGGFVESFNKWSDAFGITTPLRFAGYISQVAVETGELKWFEELASGAAYDTGHLASVLGNTPEKDGDGQRFKGRGCLMLTGMGNYQGYASSPYCVGDLMSHPEWLAQYPGAQKSAMWYWKKNKLNRFADKGDIKGLSKAVNGGYNGLSQRMYYYRVAKRVLGL